MKITFMSIYHQNTCMLYLPCSDGFQPSNEHFEEPTQLFKHLLRKLEVGESLGLTLIPEYSSK